LIDIANPTNAINKPIIGKNAIIHESVLYPRLHKKLRNAVNAIAHMICAMIEKRENPTWIDLNRLNAATIKYKIAGVQKDILIFFYFFLIFILFYFILFYFLKIIFYFIFLFIFFKNYLFYLFIFF
jgi:hypothetical protein